MIRLREVAEESSIVLRWQDSFQLVKENLKELDNNFKNMAMLFRNQYKTSKQASKNKDEIIGSLKELVLCQDERDILEQKV